MAEQNIPWYALSVEEALQRLNTTSAGITPTEAQSRQQQYGKNELPTREGTPLWQMFIEQFRDVTVLLLIFAAAVSIALGEVEDSVAIIAIVTLNAVIGIYQERQAENALAALGKLQTPIVQVRRDGRVQEISAVELVPGDIVLLDAGSTIPADGRLIQAVNVKVDEAAMTGESLPVDKDTTPLPPSDPPPALADQINMAYMGTAMTYGRAELAVTGTGLQTQLGNIATLLQQVEQGRTPLQERLEKLGLVLAQAVIGISIVVFLTGLLRGEDPREMFLTAVSLAVAAVPEGLPALITVALALGANRMVKRNALIRKLPAVETLGSVTTICSDKTGTLTRNEMTVTQVIVPNHVDIAVTGVGYAPEGQILNADSRQPFNVQEDKQIAQLVKASALCTDAHLEHDASANKWKVVGDTTEGALLAFAGKLNWTREGLENELPRVGEIPFTSERKAMTTFHESRNPQADDIPTDARFVAYIKGAPDQLLSWASTERSPDGSIPLTEESRQVWQTQIDRLASEGVRVLGIAYRPFETLPADMSPENVERDLTLMGLIGIIDPPRNEARDAVGVARRAGIRPIMITGDHRLTAISIARDLGIMREGETAMSGAELDATSDEELQKRVKNISVFARVSPEHKLRVVKALQANGEVVAMTGDGVNDAPALKQASIGVAMGITGTDVSKGAADMVLTDDNFASIVAAVQEGRTIYDNIRKFLRYLLGSNTGEVLTMFVAILLGFRIPLLAIQILWVNLVTDGLPAIALGFEKSEPGVMNRKPRPPKESIFARGVGLHVLWVGAWVAAVTLFGFTWSLGQHGGDIFNPDDEHLEIARTMAFTVLALAQLCHVSVIHAGNASFLQAPIWENRLLLVAILVTAALQLSTLYIPFFQTFLETTALDATHVLVALVLALSIIPAVEIEKAMWRSRPEADPDAPIGNPATVS